MPQYRYINLDVPADLLGRDEHIIVDGEIHRVTEVIKSDTMFNSAAGDDYIINTMFFRPNGRLLFRSFNVKAKHIFRSFQPVSWNNYPSLDW